MKTRNKAVPASYAFFEQDGRYLLKRRCNTGYEDGNYQVPAGHIEEGELPTQALIREVKEEIGVSIAPENIELVHISYRPKHDATGDRVDFFFRVHKWTGQIRIMEPDKCDDLQWFELHNLPVNITPHVRDALICVNKGEIFKELDVQYLKDHGQYKL